MRTPALQSLLSLLSLAPVIGGCAAPTDRPEATDAAESAVVVNPERVAQASTELGAFSVSLAVKDLAASRAFYEALGFAAVNGAAAQNWLILRNGTTTIGLFQGMLPGNSLTFNPGWDPFCNTLPEFADVRELQRTFEARGLTLASRADEATSGPGFFTVVDPDGNMLLFDQHVPSPER